MLTPILSEIEDFQIYKLRFTEDVAFVCVTITKYVTATTNHRTNGQTDGGTDNITIAKTAKQ